MPLVSRKPFLQRFKMIARLAAALPAVLDRLCGAVADAGHAVRAAPAPDRLAVVEQDVVDGAAAGAAAAAGAGLTDAEGAIRDEAGIKGRIHRPAHQPVIEVVPGRVKGAAAADRVDGAVKLRLGLGDDLPRLLRLRGVEQGNVVLGHDELRRAHGGQPLFPAKRPVIPVGAADLAAAGHDEPHLLRAGQRRFAQMLAHDARNAPRVGRRDDDEARADLDRRRVAGLDALVQTEQRLVQRLGNAPRRIVAVSRAGKIKNHVEPSVPVDSLPVERRRAEKSDPRGAKSAGRFHYISLAEYAQEKPGSICRNTLAILPKFR